MRKTTLALSMMFTLAAMPLQAQVAPAQPPTPPQQAVPAQQATVGADGIRTEATVIVDGTQPGPGLWLVRKGAHDLWILGTISPLPANFQWQTRQIDEVIANAQEVIYQPSMQVSPDIGKFHAMFLLPSLIGIKNNPDGKKLSDVLPAATYVRWSAFRDRFLDRDDDKLRPAFAADALWKAAIKRSGMSDKGIVSPVVAAAVERHQPKVTLVKHTIMVKDPKTALKQFKAAELEDLACLERTLDRLGEDMELLRGRANAWATGDVAALRAMPQTDQYQACLEAITESGIGRKLGMGDVAAKLREEWYAKADAALDGNTTTFAVLPMRELLRPGGVVDTLKAKGYTVLAPDE